MVDASEQIEKFQEFFKLEYEEELHELAKAGKNAIFVDFLKLAKFEPSLSEELLNEPEETIRAAEVAINQMDFKQPEKVRFFNIPKSQKITIRDIRSANINKFIALEGLVRQSSDVRPQVTTAKFECPSCGNTISVLQVDQMFKEPYRCTCGRRGKFRLLNKSLIDAQHLKIEEAPESLTGGEQPKRVSVFLQGDLVEPKMEKKTMPGSKIRIIGTVKEVVIPLRSGGISTRYDLIIEANNIEPIEAGFEEVEITKKDEEDIIELAKDPLLYEKFKKSIAPSIYGYDNIKEALVLQLFGGVKKEKKDGAKIRGDMHILLVGDPGSAKSTILLYMARAAPKARYIAGKGATGAGMTATVVKDEFLRGWALEAGTLVLANGGFAMLDELDKMSTEDTDALHEALAQQTITISKANIQATLKAETTVLAAANPKAGRFSKYMPIASQIHLPPTLINRFDLIFVIIDKPNKELDNKIATHVLGSQKEDDYKIEIPLALLKKYVAYARQKTSPKLTDAAIEEIKNFYVTLRNSATRSEDETSPIPITARQLETLVRLAEANARVRLSDTITKNDAKKAINTLKSCLMDVGFDEETGQFDIDKMTIGISTAQRSKMMLLREIITSLEEKNKSVLVTDIIEEAKNKNVSANEVNDLLEKMKREGLIFEPKKDIIQRI